MQVLWKKRLDANTLVTTPNTDVIYAMSYIDVGRDGPKVFETTNNFECYFFPSDN